MQGGLLVQSKIMGAVPRARHPRSRILLGTALAAALIVAAPIAAHAFMTETEGNNTRAAADGYLTSGVQIQGRIHPENADWDYYRFYVGKDASTVAVTVSREGDWTSAVSPAYCTVKILNSSGAKVSGGIASPGIPWTHRLNVGCYYVYVAPGLMTTCLTYGIKVSGTNVTTVRPATPSSSSTMSHLKSYSISGALTPRHTAGTTAVYVYKWRKSSTGTWVSKGHISTTTADSGDISAYSAKVRLSSAGKWRIRAYHPGGPNDAAWSSGYKYITVK
jgi:hypothetical protein